MKRVSGKFLFPGDLKKGGVFRKLDFENQTVKYLEDKKGILRGVGQGGLGVTTV